MDIKSDLEVIDEVTRRIAVKIPTAVIDEEKEKILANVSQKAKIKGFRPGKTPKNIVDKMYGESSRLDAINKLIGRSVDKVIDDNSLQIVGNPDIEVISPGIDTDLEFKATFYLYPSPSIKSYEKFEVELPRTEVSDQEINEVVERFRKTMSHALPIEGRTAVQKGDLISGKITVSIVGEEQGISEPFSGVVGEGEFVGDLESGLADVNIGEQKEILSTISNDHQNEKLRGKDIKYLVTVDSISTLIPPDVDDTFAKSLGLEVETVLELRLKIREMMEKEQQSKLKSEATAVVLEKLVAENDFLVPQVLVDDELRHLLTRSGFAKPGAKDADSFSVDPFRKDLGPVAEKRVKTSIIVDRIMELEKINATKEELSQAFTELVERHGASDKDIKEFFSDKKRSMAFVLEVTRNKVLDFLYDRTVVNYTAKSAGDKVVPA